jgi:hypothetical protein
MRPCAFWLVSSLALLLTLPAQAAPPKAPPVLPLRTVRLYETGVGYFQRAGHIDAEATLPVPAGHVDDALKTLVVLSSDGVHVQGVQFGSSVSKGMARTLAGLPPKADAPIGYEDILGSLKGAALNVATAKEHFGARLVDLSQEEVVVRSFGDKDAKAKEKGGETELLPIMKPTKELVLVFLTDKGEIRKLRASDVTALRPTDPAFAGRLGSALDALSTQGSQARRSLTLAGTSGTVTLGYVAETPIWRTTWRLVVDAKGKSALQGWALLHNDTDEDWQKVKVDLVNGRPDSFLYPLAAPRYARRELVTPQNALSTVPQLIDTTVDAIWGDNLDGEGLGLSGHGSGGGGYGMGMGSISTHGRGMGSAGYGGLGVSGDVSSGLLDVGNLAAVAEAEGVEAGALFDYTLAEPLDLKAHSSALVPFLSQRTSAEPITWIATTATSPRTAVRFVNDTRQTLPSGPIACFADGGFAGEAALERLKPGDRRFLTFGYDLDVELSVRTESVDDEVKRLRVRGDSLEEHFLRSSKVEYTVENRSGRGRSVYVGLDLHQNAKVEGADGLDYDTQEAKPVAIFKLTGKQKAVKMLASIEGLQRATKFGSLSALQLGKLAALASLPEADRKIARDAAARQTLVETHEKAIALLKEDMSRVQADLDRFREHLKALGGEKGIGRDAADNPFVQRVLKAEDQLAEQRRKLRALEDERPGKAEAVRLALAKLPK